MARKMTFRECTRVKLENLFGLRKSLNNPALDRWLQTDVTVSEHEKVVLKAFQAGLMINGEAWNEHELSMNFIGPVLSMAQLSELYRFNLFSQREIGTTVASVEEDIELSGKPDGIIATGFWEPEIPMFAFSEYKKDLDSSGDPAGQALAAMLVGQTLNKNGPNPLYGCYVAGYSWSFLVLEGKHYTISRNFSSQTDEVFDILRILKALKLILMDLTS
ncbi:MAG: hypothetical protein AAF639_47325 [Chloroflexota bacterium]